MSGICLLNKNNQKSFLNHQKHDYRDPLFLEEDANATDLATCKNWILGSIAFFIFVYLCIVARIFSLCLANGIQIRSFNDIKDEPSVNTAPPISRADIIDRNGNIIATSLPTVDLQINAKLVQNPQEVTSRLLAVFSDLKYNDILQKASKKRSAYLIKRNLSPAQQRAVNDLGIPSLEFLNSEKRVYPHKNLFAHIVGYTNIDNIGLSGIEKTLHRRLTESSKALKLSIDMGIQYTIHEELAAAIKEFDAAGASAILMDVNSGEIISMVSLPDFNPNIKIPLGERSLFNFATQGVYEAGSVFKTFNTALGLESGKVKATDKFDATKPIKIQGATISDYRGENRWLSVGEILIHSSNIGSAQLISKVGREYQRKFMINMGFSEPLKNFEIAEKGRPLFPTESKWRDDTMATVSYGYGISVTPLHLISAFSALMNGGIYNYPTIIANSQKEAPRRVISERTSEQMRHLLRDVVIYGSGKKADVAGYQVAGKTGTANKLVNGRYIDKKVMTSFLSAFPASNPKYALLVVMDEPKGSKKTWGFVTSGWNAVPTGGKIISAIAPQLNIPTDFDVDKQRQNIKAAYVH